MLTIKTFTANANGVDSIELYVVSDTPPTAASIIFTDGSVLDILADFIPAGPPNEFQASVFPTTEQPSFADGIFTLDIDNGVEQFVVSIGNLLAASQYLLAKTLAEDWDCVLLQNLEGVRQLIIANEGDLARSIYLDLQKQAATCSDAPQLDYHIEKTSIWIVDNLYVIF